jgi:hypothetical protein
LDRRVLSDESPEKLVASRNNFTTGSTFDERRRESDVAAIGEALPRSARVQHLRGVKRCFRHTPTGNSSYFGVKLLLWMLLMSLTGNLPSVNAR